MCLPFQQSVVEAHFVDQTTFFIQNAPRKSAFVTKKKEVRKSTKKGENIPIRQLPFTDTISANVYILCSVLPIRYTWYPKPCQWFIYCHIESLVDHFCFLESPFSAFMTFFLCFNMCPKSTGNPGMYVSMQMMRKYLYQAPT